MSGDEQGERTGTDAATAYSRGEKAAAGIALLILAAMSLMALDMILDGRLTGGTGHLG